MGGIFQFHPVPTTYSIHSGESSPGNLHPYHMMLPPALPTGSTASTTRSTTGSKELALVKMQDNPDLEITLTTSLSFITNNTSTLKKYDEGVMKIVVMERTLECVFRNLMEYFGDMIDLLDYLEEEVRNPPHTYIVGGPLYWTVGSHQLVWLGRIMPMQ